MARLIELITERENLVLSSDVTVDTTNYKQHSNAGNLFRLMVILSPNQLIPLTSPSNLITKMLADFPAESLSKVQRLQAKFNHIKKTMKIGKKPSGALRKEYFTLLFSLLLPLTADGKLKPTSIVNIYSKGGASGIATQTKTSIAIGRALIKNASALELTSRDIAVIKGYPSNSDTPVDVDDVSDMDTPIKDTPSVDIKDKTVASVVSSASSTEELIHIVEKSERMIEQVNALNVDNTVELSRMLISNEDASIHHITLTGADASVSDNVNTKITAVFNKVREEIGIEAANFTAKIAADIFTRLNETNGYLQAFKDTIQLDFMTEDNQYRFKVVVAEGMGDSPERFCVDQVFTLDGSQAYMEEIQMPTSLQGKGLNKGIFKDNIDIFKAKGIETVELTANVDVGGYAWFRYGFVPVDLAQLAGITDWITNMGPVVVKALVYDRDDVIEFIEIHSSNNTGVKNLCDAMRIDDDRTSKIVIQFMADCGRIFKSTFNSIGTFKSLGKAVAIDEFDTVIDGVNYTMSYKAVLSLQALSDSSGQRIMPLLPKSHLNWKATLDMNDLEDTYAYLNIK